MNNQVFINYRREDTSAEAQLIYDALSEILSEQAIFMDTETINVGENWPDRIRSALINSQTIIVVIGPDWLKVGMDEWGRRRIDNESDWVRQEISTALCDEQKSIIPVLVRDATMPPPDALPSCIATIADKQQISIRSDYWNHDIDFLKKTLNNDASLDDFGQANPLLRSVWNNLDDELRKIMAVAATLAQIDNKDYIATTNFVKALMVIKPGRISEFFDALPPNALPEDVPSNISLRMDSLKQLDSFSPCISSAMSHLTPMISETGQLSSEDLYIDIARYGTGKSTRLLRNHGVSKEAVEQIVSQLGWQLVERSA